MRRAAAAAAHLDEERAEELTDAAPDAGAHPKVVAGTLTFGMFRFPNGAEQQGPFHEGKLHGSNCVYVWPSGNRFEGAMQHGRRVGIGKKTWKASGNSYAGEWANDQCAGFGVALDCNATIQRCGVWKGNVLAQSRPVPLSHLPADMFAKERGQSRACGACCCLSHAFSSLSLCLSDTRQIAVQFCCACAVSGIAAQWTLSIFRTAWVAGSAGMVE